MARVRREQPLLFILAWNTLFFSHRLPFNPLDCLCLNGNSPYILACGVGGVDFFSAPSLATLERNDIPVLLQVWSVRRSFRGV